VLKRPSMLNQKIRKLLDLINTFTILIGHKINMQKLVPVLYTKSKLAKKEIMAISPLAIAPQNQNT
jgi:hypothetical protein